MFSLPEYAKVKDHYCISYFGNSDEYLVQLRLLKPILESQFSGINIKFGCKDEKTHLLKEETLKVSDLKVRKREFAQIKTLTYNGETHPVEDLLVESGISTFAIPVHKKEEFTNKMVIVTQGSYPTSSLIKKEIQILKVLGNKSGYEVELNTNWENAGWVVGVESVPIFEAAAVGIRTSLIPKGVGTRLYQKMFPDGEIINF